MSGIRRVYSIYISALHLAESLFKAGRLRATVMDVDLAGSVTCPLCGEFQGKVDSVVGHITASTDEEHSGEKGENYLPDLVSDEDAREEGRARELGPDEEPADDPDSEPDEGPVIEPADEGDNRADDDPGDGTLETVDVEPPEGVETGEVKQAKLVEDDDGSAVVKMVLTGGLALLLWRLSQSGSNEPEIDAV